jgi:hypothetical protein
MVHHSDTPSYCQRRSYREAEELAAKSHRRSRAHGVSVEDAIRVSQDNEDAVAFGLAAARIIEVCTLLLTWWRSTPCGVWAVRMACGSHREGRAGVYSWEPGSRGGGHGTAGGGGVRRPGVSQAPIAPALPGGLFPINRIGNRESWLSSSRPPPAADACSYSLVCTALSTHALLTLAVWGGLS